MTRALSSDFARLSTGRHRLWTSFGWLASPTAPNSLESLPHTAGVMSSLAHDDTIWLKRVDKQREALIADPVPRVGSAVVLPAVPLVSRTLSGVSRVNRVDFTGYPARVPVWLPVSLLNSVFVWWVQERPKHRRQPIFDERAQSANLTGYTSGDSDWAPPTSPVALSSHWTEDLSVEGSEVLPASAPQLLLSPPKLVNSVLRSTRESIPEIQVLASILAGMAWSWRR